MKKISFLAMLGLMISLMATTAAFAHVTVQPRQTTQGSYEKFAVSVPTEKDIPTVKVEVRFPIESVTISRFEPKPGWTYELARNADNIITGVIWTATGPGLSATEFGEFYMQGKVADQATEIVWKAYQTYSDGSIVEWTGAAGSDKPASVTTVAAKPAGSGGDGHGHSNSTGDVNAAATSSSQLPMYFSIAALVMGITSIFISLAKKSKS